MIAAQGPIDLQAQAGPAQVAAKDMLEIKTAQGVIQIAAGKRVYLSTAGGAYMHISGDNIEVGCPGKILVQAGQKRMVGPDRMNADHPAFPKSEFFTPLRVNFDHAPHGVQSSWAGMPYKVFADGAQIEMGVLDQSGGLLLKHSPVTRRYVVEMANGVRYELPVVDQYTNPAQGRLAAQGFMKHEPGSPAADTGATRAGSTTRERYARSLKGLGEQGA
jgi:type VI secretion system secreted protein VgrG